MGQERCCDDCGDVLEPGQRRVRCANCRQLVCPWCFHHVHRLADHVRRLARREAEKGARIDPRLEAALAARCAV